MLGGTTTVNAVAGIATFSTLSINKAFTGYTLVATAGALTVTSTAFNIAPGGSSALVISTQPVSTTAGASITPVVVTAEDANGNVMPGFTGAVTMALGTTTSGAVLSGTVTVNAVAGAGDVPRRSRSTRRSAATRWWPRPVRSRRRRPRHSTSAPARTAALVLLGQPPRRGGERGTLAAGPGE